MDADFINYSIWLLQWHSKMQNIIITYYYQLLALNWILSRIILSYFLILRIKFDAVYNLDIALCFSMLFVINMSPEVVSSKHAHLYVCVESVLELALCQLAIILYSYCVLLHYIYLLRIRRYIGKRIHAVWKWRQSPAVHWG